MALHWGPCEKLLCYGKLATSSVLKSPSETVLPDTFAAEGTDNIEQAIKSVTGLEMRVSVVEPSMEENETQRASA